MSETLAAWLNIVGILGGVLVIAGMLTWAERRLLALWQERYGPNRVGPFGLLQPLADVIKLMMKEDWIPPMADRPVFVIAPALAMATALAAFAVIPITPSIGIVDNLDIGLLFFLAMAALTVYGVAMGGWASNSKYSLLGGVRSAAQMISYEIFMGLSLMGVVILAGSFDLRQIVLAQQGLWYAVPQLPGMVLFFIAGVAGIHRLPFDLPEAENELVAGYHTEYSSMKFGMFFVGEYVGMLLLASMVTTLFLGGWLGPLLPPILWFFLKTAAVLVLLVLLRAALPRPRYDQLMALGWKVMLPLALLNLVVTGGALLAIKGPLTS
ncbi:MAG: NADH-quinone oxidoreductase subunit NuoH [Chromatiaceae bacterium]